MRYSTIERVKACSLLELYISNVVEQVDAALAILCMENKLRRLKGLEHFKIPVLTPNTHTIESNIQLEAYCQAVDNEVKTIFEEAYKLEGIRLMEEQRRRQQPLLPTTSRQEMTWTHQSSFTQTEIQKGIATTTSSLPETIHRQEVPPSGHQHKYPHVSPHTSATKHPIKEPTSQPPQQV